MTYFPAYSPKNRQFFWERSTKPHRNNLPPDLFARLGGEPASIYFWSGGNVDHRYYPDPDAALHALAIAREENRP